MNNTNWILSPDGHLYDEYGEKRFIDRTFDSEAKAQAFVDDIGLPIAVRAEV